LRADATDPHRQTGGDATGQRSGRRLGRHFPLPGHPTIAYEEAKTSLIAQAKLLEDSSAAKARAAMVLEHAELDPRRFRRRQSEVETTRLETT